LRPGTTHPMDEASRSTMRGHWERVHGASGQPFDFAFFDRERFVYDTEPACRAVVVMRRRGATDALGAFRRIQFAFYAENRDVTCVETLAEIACELGCDEAEFRTAFAEAAAVEETRTDFAITQQAGIDGFPTLLAGKGLAASYALVSQGFQPAIDPAAARQKFATEPARQSVKPRSRRGETDDDQGQTPDIAAVPRA
jgi:putative protein-disulfide isomerase